MTLKLTLIKQTILEGKTFQPKRHINKLCGHFTVIKLNRNMRIFKLGSWAKNGNTQQRCNAKQPQYLRICGVKERSSVKIR